MSTCSRGRCHVRLLPLAAPITVEEVADAVAETVDQAAKAAFRIPVGETAETLLAARKAAPEDAPFLAAPLDW